MIELKNEKIAVPVVLFAGLLWSFGPLVVRYMDNPHMVPWQYIFGLPGNPISSAACFRFFVYPYLQESLGISNEKSVKAVLKNNFIKKINFTRFVKSRINTTKNGKLEVKILKGQESFRIQSFIKSNIWTLLPSGKGKFKKGDIVDCFFQNYPNKIF